MQEHSNEIGRSQFEEYKPCVFHIGIAASRLSASIYWLGASLGGAAEFGRSFTRVDSTCDFNALTDASCHRATQQSYSPSFLPLSVCQQNRPIAHDFDVYSYYYIILLYYVIVHKVQ